MTQYETAPRRRTREALRAYRVGQRVQLHPATDTWMQGDRYGVIERIGDTSVCVRMDASGRLLRAAPHNLLAEPQA